MSPLTTEGHRIPALSVDAVVIQGADILLIRRRSPPFADEWALPGGFVEEGETVEAATRREVLEETQIAVELTSLIGVYSDPERDPRHHTVTVAHLARPSDPRHADRVRGSDDAAEARWFPVDAMPPLAFDHDQIVTDALTRHRPSTG